MTVHSVFTALFLFYLFMSDQSALHSADAMPAARRALL